MTDRLDLPRRYREELEALLRKHVPDAKVWAHGSRVNGRSHDGSDLDLVLRSTTLEPLGYEYVELVEALEQSSIPILVQAQDWAGLPESFQREIERDCVVVQNGIGTDQTAELSEWPNVPLDEITTLTLSSVDKKSKANEKSVRLCNYMDVYSNNFISSNLDFMAATATEREVANCSLFAGDVVITKDSEKHDDIGVPALVREDLPGFVCGYHLAILRPRPSSLDGAYLFYALNDSKVQEQFHSYANGVTRLGLRKADIGIVEIPLPSLSEQRAIAHILGVLDDKIELNRRMNETLEQMARAIFQDRFVDFGPVRAKAEGWEPYLPPELWALFPDRLVDSDLGKIPQGWEVKSLSDCIEVARGLSYKGSGLASDGMPMHNLNSIYEGGGYKDDGIKYYNGDFQERHLTQPGDVLVANTEQGHNRLLIGFAAVSPERFGRQGLFSHHIYRIRLKRQAGLPPDFVCHLLNTQAMHDAVSGYATGTTVNMLPVDALRIPRLVAPPAGLVTTFSAMAETARSKQEELLVDEYHALAEQRDALLPQLVSGQLRIRHV